MTKVFVDTDIILDLLSQREPFYIYAANLFSQADKNRIKIYMSASSFAALYYLIAKSTSNNEARKIIGKFKVLVHVLPVNDKIIELALNSAFRDFEDAIQYYTAVENDINILLTRNLRDYKHAEIPVMSAQDFIRTLK
jgi:predicted nucleic acid-binding protein